MERTRPPRQDMSAVQWPMLLRDCGSRFTLVGGNLFAGLWTEVGDRGREPSKVKGETIRKPRRVTVLEGASVMGAGAPLGTSASLSPTRSPGSPTATGGVRSLSAASGFGRTGSSFQAASPAAHGAAGYGGGDTSAVGDVAHEGEGEEEPVMAGRPMSRTKDRRMSPDLQIRLGGLKAAMATVKPHVMSDADIATLTLVGQPLLVWAEQSNAAHAVSNANNSQTDALLSPPLPIPPGRSSCRCGGWRRREWQWRWQRQQYAPQHVPLAHQSRSLTLHRFREAPGGRVAAHTVGQRPAYSAARPAPAPGSHAVRTRHCGW